MSAWTIILLVCTCWLWIPLGTALSVAIVGGAAMLIFAVCFAPIVAVMWIAARIGKR